MPAVEPGKIRNLAVAGHRGTGKTSLVEALLFQSGATTRLGTVEAGTTVSDWDEDERKRQLSLAGLDLPRALAREQAQPDRHARRRGLPGRPAGGAARRRRRAARRQRRDGYRGADRKDLEARRGARAGTLPRRQHARPRARRLLPRPRPARGPALSPLRRGADPDRRRARAEGSRRSAADEGLREPGGRQGRRTDRDSCRDRRHRRRVPREAARRHRRDRRGADGALPGG